MSIMSKKIGLRPITKLNAKAGQNIYKFEPDHLL